MPSRRFWIIAGVLATGAGLTAVAAHGYRGHHSHGWHHGEGGYHGERHRGWRRWFGRGPVSKDDYDARTRSRFARIDANSDGTVDGDEAKAMIERRMEKRQRRWRPRRSAQRMMRRFDVDKDGKVTRDEFETRVTEIFGRADLDRDGKITDADLPPMMRDRGVLSGNGEMRRRGRRGARFMRFLRGADTNGDNIITFDEAKVAAFKRFDRFDRNNDQVVEKSDLQGLRSEVVDYRVRRFMHRYGGDAQGKVTLEQFSKFRDERFARLDFNNDGELSRDELPGRRMRKSKRWKEWRGEHRGHGPRHDDRPSRRGEHRGERGGENPERRL